MSENSLTAPPNSTRATMSVLKARVREYVTKCAEAEKRDDELQALYDELRKLEQETIPALMNEAELESLTFQGVEVVLENEVISELPKDPAKRQKAIDGLMQTGNGGAVKRVISIVLERGDAATEEQLLDLLKRSHNELGGNKFSVSVRYDVHHSTYGALMRRLYKQGTSLDPRVMGVFMRQRAAIKS